MRTKHKTNKIKRDQKRSVFNVIGYLYITFFTLACILPFCLILTGSFTSEESIIRDGFRLVPKEFSLRAFEIIFSMPQNILNAYAVSVTITVAGSLTGLFLMSMTAYVLQRKDFRYRNFFSFFFYFTTLFSGGLVPYYLLIVKYLEWKNTLWALLVPSIMSAWLVLLMRNFMRSIPDSIIESAKIDGAGDFAIFIKFILPLSKPGLATIGLFLALSYWNDWFTAMLFIEEPKLYPLQYLLYKIIQSVEGIRTASARGATIIAELPSESLKMATAVIATGPIIMLYPFIQKYFVKGLTIGSVKG